MEKANERGRAVAGLPRGTDEPDVRHTPGPSFLTVHQLEGEPVPTTGDVLSAARRALAKAGRRR